MNDAPTILKARLLSAAQINLLRRALQSESKRLLEEKERLVAAMKTIVLPDRGEQEMRAHVREIDESIKANDAIAEYLLKGDR